MLSNTDDVVRPLSFLFLFQFKLNVVTLHEDITESGVLHIALVEKNLFASLRCDKPEPFHRIIEFYGTLVHVLPFFSNQYDKKTPVGVVTNWGSKLRGTLYLLDVGCL
jgi:hypothetical protein